MMRLIRPAVVALSGLALALSLPAGAALAAKGPFTWVGPKGKPFFVENPPDGRCLDMSQEAHGPHNGTGTTATVYTKKKCKGEALHLKPGQQAPRSASFSSVRFG
ncbi:hypothetical protein AB0K09_18460 [Streptomyces sp. NPDC049577]|uniref:hypothetical protein n=1 Tax=Streptomyces sp. NPDC049577 TaxID=3155153 RepID=UPI00342C7EC4